MSVYRDLRLQTDNGVTTITLSRPEVRNALRPETYDELCEAVTTADARVLVVTGEDPAFCSGDDVRVLMPVDNVSERRPKVPALTPAASALLHTNLPVIAAVNGAAVIRTIAALAQSLGVRMTAEGVETDDQLTRLASYGCDEAQGYLFSRPLPASDIGLLVGGAGQERETRREAVERRKLDLAS